MLNAVSNLAFDGDKKKKKKIKKVTILSSK